MASRYRSLSKPTFSLLKSTTNKPTLQPKSTPSLLPARPSLTFSRPVPQLGAIQSLLPFHSAVSSARLTSCLSIDSRSSRSLSQGMLCSANPGVWYSPNVLVLVSVSNFFTLQLVHVSILNRVAWFCLFVYLMFISFKMLFGFWILLLTIPFQSEKLNKCYFSSVSTGNSVQLVVCSSSTGYILWRFFFFFWIEVSNFMQ